jgi:hypothetical protein
MAWALEIIITGAHNRIHIHVNSLSKSWMDWSHWSCAAAHVAATGCARDSHVATKS